MTDYYVKDGETYKIVSLDDLIKSEKLVKEADFLTVKGSAETRQNQLEAKNTELQSKVDELTTRATTAESALEGVNKELEPLKVEAAKVPTLEQQVTELTSAKSAAETQLLDTRRDSVIQKYNITGEQVAKVKSMTVEQLTSFEESATVLGITGQSRPNPTPLARGDGGRNDTEQSALKTISEGLKELQPASSTS